MMNDEASIDIHTEFKRTLDRARDLVLEVRKAEEKLAAFDEGLKTILSLPLPVELSIQQPAPDDFFRAENGAVKKRRDMLVQSLSDLQTSLDEQLRALKGQCFNIAARFSGVPPFEEICVAIGMLRIPKSAGNAFLRPVTEEGDMTFAAELQTYFAKKKAGGK